MRFIPSRPTSVGEWIAVIFCVVVSVAVIIFSLVNIIENVGKW